MGVYLDGDMDENERFIRNIYPNIGIERWWGSNLGIYDVSARTEDNKGNFLGVVYKDKNDSHRNDWKRTWENIRKHIEEEIMYQLEGNTQEKPSLPVIFRRSKKAP
jgi:hypothetical protein